MNEEVAISVTIDIPANEQKVTELTHNIQDLTDETKKLSEANKQLTKEGKSTSDAYTQNSKQVEVNKQKIDANSASRKNLVKTLDSERLSTIGVKDAMSTLSPALSSATTGAISLGRAMLALALNPVGLVITAVAAALATVYTFLTRTQAGADALEDAFTAITTTIDVLLDRLARVGEGLFLLFSGEFEKGIYRMTTAFDGMGQEIVEEVKAANELNEAIRNLEDSEIDLEIASAKTENTVKRLLLQARNRTITEQERLKFLEQASAAEEKLNQDRLKNANEAIKIAASEAAARLNIRQKENESSIAFGERLIEAFKGQGAAQADDLRDNLKDALIAYQQVTGQSLALQEKIQNQRDAAEAKIEEQELKQIERDQKQLELDAQKAAKQQAELEAINLRVQAAQTEEERLAELFANSQFRNDQELSDKEEQTKANEDLKKSIQAVSIARENEYKKTSALNSIYTQAANFISQIAGENKELALASVIIQKAAAIGQIIASTAIANAKAVAASPLTFGLPWTAINTASAGISIASLVAEGAKSISEITAAAGGGNFLTKGPTLLLVGDNPGGIERVTVEPLSGRGKTKVGSGMVDLSMAGGGTLTTMGSLTTGSARIAESSMNINQLASLMNMVKIAVVYDDVEAKGLTKEEITTRAQVI